MGSKAVRGDDSRFTREVVDLVGEYVALGARGFEAEHGGEATNVVQGMMAALMGQLEGNLGHVVLWEQFLQTPDEVCDALVGVVTALRCRNPGFDEWLAEAWGRYRAHAHKEDEGSTE